MTDAAAPAAPQVSATRTLVSFTTNSGQPAELDCLYVIIDVRSRRDLSDFLAHARTCCDEVSLDWQAVRRPPSALVGLELRRCCAAEGETAAMRLVFDVERDAAALNGLADTEVIVVATRPYGGFANTLVAFGVDGSVVRRTAEAARAGVVRVRTHP